MKKAILTIIILLLIGGAGACLYFFVLKDKLPTTEDKVFVQRVSSLQSYGGYSNRYSGVVETQKTEKVEFPTDQKLKELFVAEGDTIKEGDPLFCYDTESISLEIDQLNLEIERLNTTITNDTTQIEQLTKDMEKVAEADRLEYTASIAELQADIAQTQYDIKSKEAEILKKQSSIENSTVFAKMGGTIQSVADLDAILSGTSYDRNGNPDSTYITIRAEGDFRIKGRISETNIYEIYVGEEMLVRSRINEEQTWHGTVSLIDTQSNADENQNGYYDSGSGERATKYPFYIELDSTDGLMLGQHVIIEPNLGEDPTAEGIWLNSGWLFEEDGNYYVWAAASDGARLEKRAVTIGRYLEETDLYEIADGLLEKEYIAWPDPSVYAGAPTTSEYVMPEGEDEPAAEMTEDGVYTEEVFYEEDTNE